MIVNANERCPLCRASLTAGRIPEESRGHYDEGRTHYSRRIGVEIRGVYDGVLYYECPDCGGRWHRFPVGHYLRERAEAYVKP